MDNKHHWYDDIPEDIKIFRKKDKYFTHRALYYNEENKCDNFLIEIDFTGDYSYPTIYKYSDVDAKSEIEAFVLNHDGWNIVDKDHESASPDIISNILIVCERLKKEMNISSCNS